MLIPGKKISLEEVLGEMYEVVIKHGTNENTTESPSIEIKDDVIIKRDYVGNDLLLRPYIEIIIDKVTQKESTADKSRAYLTKIYFKFRWYEPIYSGRNEGFFRIAQISEYTYKFLTDEKWFTNDGFNIEIVKEMVNGFVNIAYFRDLYQFGILGNSRCFDTDAEKTELKGMNVKESPDWVMGEDYSYIFTKDPLFEPYADGLVSPYGAPLLLLKHNIKGFDISMLLNLLNNEHNKVICKTEVKDKLLVAPEVEKETD